MTHILYMIKTKKTSFFDNFNSKCEIFRKGIRIFMEKIAIQLNNHEYKSKPEGREFAIINKKITGAPYVLPIDIFADKVGNKGCTFLRAIIQGKRKDDNFVKQILMVLDFDGTIAYEEFRKRCQIYDLHYAFTYKTFSFKANDYRFRAVFVMDHWIMQKGFALGINRMMLELFPEADQSCKDLSRMFLGGVGIIEKDCERVVPIIELIRIFENHLKEIKRQNYMERLRSFARIMGVGIVGSKLGLFDVNTLEKEEIDKIDSKVIEENMLIVLPDASKQNVDDLKKKLNKKRNHSLYEIKEDMALENICQMMQDFKTMELEHRYKFLLATSLYLIKGGKEIFFEYLQEHIKEWEIQWKHIEDKAYNPQRCEEICPYWESCRAHSLYDKVNKKILKLEETNFITLEEAEEKLQSSIEEAVAAYDQDIHIIKAQTALGKTEQYCRIVKSRCDKNFIIAVPTIQLQLEVAGRLKEKGVECEITESIRSKVKNLHIDELNDCVDEAYDAGYGRRVVKIIWEFLQEHAETLTIDEKHEIGEILKEQKADISNARCIVTTHAFFLIKKLYEMQDYEMIIDEDILVTLFRNEKGISTETLKRLLERDAVTDWNKNQICNILKMENGMTCKVNFLKLTENEIDELYSCRKEVVGPIPDFFDSSVALKKKDHVFFLQKPDFLNRGKLIIVSATVNQKLYQDYFRNDKIHFKEIREVRYKGKVIQHTAYSLSRLFLKKNGMQAILEQIKEKFTGEIPIISFKLLFPCSEIHFGKTEGFDVYKGKDIAVIGTPHNAMVIYKLVGALLEYDVSGRLSTHRVKRNSYSFPIMTYTDADMQNLQLFYIESELEQAIGRARLLRCECTVYVFSNYPCRQAQLNQEAYLQLNNAEEDEAEEEILES